MAKITKDNKPDKRGARTKYNPQIVQSICNMIKSGCTAKDAAILNDINQDTYYEWLKKHAEFSENVEKAKSYYKNQLLLRITKASDKSWQAAAWRLERTYKDEFALRTEVTGKDGKDLGIPVHKWSEEQKEKK